MEQKSDSQVPRLCPPSYFSAQRQLRRSTSNPQLHQRSSSRPDYSCLNEEARQVFGRLVTKYQFTACQLKKVKLENAQLREKLTQRTESEFSSGLVPSSTVALLQSTIASQNAELNQMRDNYESSVASLQHRVEELITDTQTAHARLLSQQLETDAREEAMRRQHQHQLAQLNEKLTKEKLSLSEQLNELSSRQAARITDHDEIFELKHKNRELEHDLNKSRQTSQRYGQLLDATREELQSLTQWKEENVEQYEAAQERNSQLEQKVQEATQSAESLGRLLDSARAELQALSQWKHDRDTVQQKQRELEQQAGEMSSAAEYCRARIQALEKVAKIQQDSLVKEAEGELIYGDKKIDAVLSGWKTKVYELLLQQKFSEKQWNKEKFEFAQQIKDLENNSQRTTTQLQLLQLSSDDTKAHANLLQQQLHTCEQQLEQKSRDFDESVAHREEQRVQLERSASLIQQFCEQHSIEELNQQVTDRLHWLQTRIVKANATVLLIKERQAESASELPRVDEAQALRSELSLLHAQLEDARTQRVEEEERYRAEIRELSEKLLLSNKQAIQLKHELSQQQRDVSAARDRHVTTQQVCSRQVSQLQDRIQQAETHRNLLLAVLQREGLVSELQSMRRSPVSRTDDVRNQPPHGLGQMDQVHQAVGNDHQAASNDHQAQAAPTQLFTSDINFQTPVEGESLENSGAGKHLDLDDLPPELRSAVNFVFEDSDRSSCSSL